MSKQSSAHGERLDLVDAVNVASAAQFRTNVVPTPDHRGDVRAVRPLTEHAAFRVLPADR